MNIKKMRFFILLSLLIATVITFNSCAQSIPTASSFDVVLNGEYKPTVDKTEKAEEIEELYGYRFVEAKGELMTFAKIENDLSISHAVFSARNKKVVLVAESNSGESVEIKLFSGTPAFTVIRTPLLCLDNSAKETVCELYDATGALVDSVKGIRPEPILFADTLLFNCVSYSIDGESGKLSKIADIPENLYVEKCSDWNDKYFYIYDKTINVYTREFKHVYSWTIPSWGEYISQNMLSNGCVLVQYTRPLDINVDDYDIYEMDENTGETKKFDVYSVLLDPEKRSEKEIKLDYMVKEVTCGAELLRTSENNGMYCDDIENIAYIYPIENSQIDYSEANADIVLMDNKARLKKTLKIIDDQNAALPTCIGDNLYIASTTYGMAIIDIDGKILHQINNSDVATVGENIVSDNKIYTLDMTEVYSLYANGADIITYLDGTVFIKKGSTTDYSIIAINGAQQKEICRYNAFDIETVAFEAYSDIGCYALCNLVKSEYNYYNSAHELLLTSTVGLDVIAADYASGVSLYSATVGGEVKYYAFY